MEGITKNLWNFRKIKMKKSWIVFEKILEEFIWDIVEKASSSPCQD